jgi:hypothetical protein
LDCAAEEYFSLSLQARRALSFYLSTELMAVAAYGCTGSSFLPQTYFGIYSHRITRGHRDHCDSREHAAASPGTRKGKGEPHLLREQQQQIGLAMAMYSDDSNDQMPWPNWGNSYGPCWLYQPVSGRAPDPMKTNETKYIEAGVYWKYLNTRAVYNCPLDKTNHISWQKRAQRVSSYIMNGAVCGFEERPDHRTFKLSAFNPAAYVIWEPDIKNFGGSYGPNPGFDASQFPNQDEGVGRRHKKGAVITGFSGQVHFIKFEDFQREQTQNKPGLLWCVPGAPRGGG